MSFREISALRILAGAVLGAFALLSVPYHTQAESQAPDWIQGPLQFEPLDYNLTTQERNSSLQNVAGEYVTAGWDYGSFGRSKITNETWNVYPTSVGYFDGYRALPFGSDRWQKVDTDNFFYKSMFFANPNDAGVLMQRYFAQDNASYSDLKFTYYMPDWRQTFRKLNVDGMGNVTRSAPQDYNLATEAIQLKDLEGRPLLTTSAIRAAHSKNGEWVYLSTRIGELRAHIPDLRYRVLSKPGLSYYAKEAAVSNSGRFVVLGDSVWGIYLYDASRCSNDSTGDCMKTQDINRFVNQEYVKRLSPDRKVDTLSVFSLKFVNEAKLDVYFYVRYTDTTSEYKRAYVSVEPGPQTTRYLALGDSFSSGEGAGDYYDATNFYVGEQDYNVCHQSKKAYSEVIHKTLTPDWYDSIACSGAKIKDVMYLNDDNDYLKYSAQSKSVDKTPSFMEIVRNALRPGYIPQLSLLKSSIPTISTITIGGNDIGFGTIVEACVINIDCYSSRDERERLADLIDSKIPKLEMTYRSIMKNMSGNSPHLYVMGYPQLFNQEKSCSSFMNTREREFSNYLVDYLNDAIRIAAKRAGAQYVDVTTAFVDYADEKDHRLCGGAQPAVNGLTLDFKNMSDNQPLDKYLTSSYHPNAFGHTLLARRIMAYTNNFSRDMPDPLYTESKPGEAMYTRFVGDTDNTQKDIINLDSITPQTIIYGDDASVEVSYYFGEEQGFPSVGTVVTTTIQSEPVTLGTAKVKPDGTIKETYTIPNTLEPGVHTLHLKYKDGTGAPRDIVQYVYVFASKEDLDGDGIVNSAEQCSLGGVMGTDFDKDGVDDACDTDISLAPAGKAAAPSEESDIKHEVRENVKGEMSSQADTADNNQPGFDIAGVATGTQVENQRVMGQNDSSNAQASFNEQESREDKSSGVFVTGVLLTFLAGFIFYKLRR